MDQNTATEKENIQAAERIDSVESLESQKSWQTADDPHLAALVDGTPERLSRMTILAIFVSCKLLLDRNWMPKRRLTLPVFGTLNRVSNFLRATYV